MQYYNNFFPMLSELATIIFFFSQSSEFLLLATVYKMLS